VKFRYSHEKNAKLLAERGVGFEEMIEEIVNGNLITISNHHNQELYPNQKILHVKCLTKIYLVPYVVEENGTIFFKTLYPSRKATKAHLSSKKN
jgi:uncharacterized DUF497 family protein